MRDPATIDAAIAARGPAAFLAELIALRTQQAASLQPMRDAAPDPALDRLIRVIEMASPWLYNPPDAPDRAYVIQQVRECAHHEGDAALRAACDAWLADHPHLRTIDALRHPASPYLLRTLAGHTDKVRGALQLPDGRLLSWGDSTLRLWSSDGAPLAVLRGHTDRVFRAILLSDGRILSWADDHTLRLWSSDGAPLATLIGHVNEVTTAIELTDGRILSMAEHWSMWLWDADGALLAVLHDGDNYHWVMGALPLADGGMLTWSGDGMLRLWDAGGAVVRRMTGHTDRVIRVLALPYGRFVSWSMDTTIRLWSAAGDPLAVMTGHAQWVRGVLALADGRLVSWSQDGAIRLWSGEGAPLAVLDGHTNYVNVRALADGRLLSWSADRTMRLWHPDRTPPLVYQWSDLDVNAALELHDGTLLTTDAYPSVLRLWTADGAPLAVLEGHGNEVYHPLALTDGRILSWSKDGLLKLWTTSAPPPIAAEARTTRVNSLTAFPVSPSASEEKRVLTRYARKHVCAWDASGTVTAEFALSEDDEIVHGMLPLTSGRVLAWSRERLVLWEHDGTPVTVITGQGWFAGALELGDGRIFSWGKNGLLWDADGAPLGALHGHTDGMWEAMALRHSPSPEGERLLTWSQDGTVRLWDAQGRPLTVLDWQPHEGRIKALELRDGRLLLWCHYMSMGFTDGALRLYSPDGALLTLMEGHRFPPRAVLELPDGRLLTGLSDRTIRIWSAQGDLLTVLDTPTYISTVEELADDDPASGKRLLAWDETSGRGLLYTSDGTPIADDLRWHDVLRLPRARPGLMRWWDYRKHTLAHGDFSVGRVDARLVHDLDIYEIAPFSPTRCAFRDRRGRLFIVEYREGIKAIPSPDPSPKSCGF